MTITRYFAQISLRLVTALCVFTSSLTAIAEDSANEHDIVKTGYFFEIVQFEKKKDPPHINSKVLVFHTNNTKTRYGLTFVQGDGGGMSCNVNRVTKDTLSCSIENKEEDVLEVLTIAKLESEFCTILYNKYDEGSGQYKEIKSKKVKPVMTLDECAADFASNNSCICYQIEHYDTTTDIRITPDLLSPDLLPPGNGAGSGGHRP